MEEQGIWTRATEVFREILDDEDLEIKAETTAADVEGWDSLAHIQLMVALEEVFGIRISTGEMANLESVGQLIQIIGRHLEE